ncbi:hypothetical protein DL93DRAFT_1565140 [Clavulina sp. PMI_390]|nr:hypothetical protein DL93DRAFT_1565140 [Clavulina sp. PMI_390]
MALLELPYEIMVEIVTTGHLDIRSLIRLSWVNRLFLPPLGCKTQRWKHFFLQVSQNLHSSIMSNRSLWFLVVRQLMDTELTSDVALNLSTMSTHELIKCATRKLRISQTFDYSPASLPRIDRYDIVLKIPHPNPSGPLSSSPHSDHFVTPTFMNISLIPGGKWLVAVCCVDEARYLACWDIHPVTPDTNDTNSALSTPILPTAFVALDSSGENPRLKLAHILCDSMWRADQDRLLVLIRPSE